ncbi:MAG: DUF4124 domain-containing protein [Halioglobus sp.]
MTLARIHLWLLAPALLCGLPVCAATVYKSVDENGVVSFSDTLPADDILLETMVIEIEEGLAPSADAQQRLEDMRATTDRMAADRMAREKHRAEMRQLDAQTDALQAEQDAPAFYDNSTIFTGYYGYPARRPHYRPRPEHPIARPPVRPPVPGRPPNATPLPGNDYPASLIRQGYDPKVREALR